MTQITFTDDQVRLLAGASPPIVIVDSQGRKLGQVLSLDRVESIPTGLTAEEWAEIVRRKNSPGQYSTLQEIKKRLGWQDSA